MKHFWRVVTLLIAVLLSNSCEKQKAAEPVVKPAELRIQKIIITSYSGPSTQSIFLITRPIDLTNVAFGTFASPL